MTPETEPAAYTEARKAACEWCHEGMRLCPCSGSRPVFLQDSPHHVDGENRHRAVEHDGWRYPCTAPTLDEWRKSQAAAQTGNPKEGASIPETEFETDQAKRTLARQFFDDQDKLLAAHQAKVRELEARIEAMVRDREMLLKAVKDIVGELESPGCDYCIGLQVGDSIVHHSDCPALALLNAYQTVTESERLREPQSAPGSACEFCE